LKHDYSAKVTKNIKEERKASYANIHIDFRVGREHSIIGACELQEGQRGEYILVAQVGTFESGW
jgi:hypothetical protein